MVGIIKVVDKLGRIVIPKEYRDRYGLKNNAEIVATQEGVLIRNPEYMLVKINREESTSEK